MDSPKPADGDVTLGYCDSGSGKAGCVGYRSVTYFGGYWLCHVCYPHRKAIKKKHDALRRRLDSHA